MFPGTWSAAAHPRICGQGADEVAPAGVLASGLALGMPDQVELQLTQASEMASKSLYAQAPIFHFLEVVGPLPRYQSKISFA